MIEAPLPADEVRRLEALERYGVLDTAPEARFDRTTRLAQVIFDVPIALVSLVDQDRQWFKSCIGLDVLQTGRDVAFCSHAMLADGVTEVLDPTTDARFHDNPLVTGPPHIRYYAGAPLITPDGFVLGTLCIIDRVPREPLTTHQRATLRDLAHQVIDDLELRNLLGTTRTTQEQAAAANRSKMEFLAWLSHELKTPLTAIQGFAETLLRTEVDDTQQSFIEHIGTASGRVADLINDILDFARLDAGRLSVEIERFDLAALLEEPRTVLAERAAERSITVTIEAPAERVDVFGDERRAHQVLLNLLSNAIKYNRESGHVTVTVRQAAGEVHIDVADTGAGIAEVHRGTIFEPFERVPGTGQAGAGVGLALSRWLAREMDGDVTVESVLGRGSTFTFTLPRAG